LIPQEGSDISPTDIPIVGPAEDDYTPPKATAHRYVRKPPSTKWVRGVLIGMAIALSAILAISMWLNPYDADGNPRKMATHTQLGLPPCNMVTLVGKPCPSCGMTTSFALLAHGDIKNSVKANWVGTLLAGYWFALIPWSIYSAIRGKAQFVRSGEFLVTVSVILFFALMLTRWLYVLLL
jgi:hypothetical protein